MNTFTGSFTPQACRTTARHSHTSPRHPGAILRHPGATLRHPREGGDPLSEHMDSRLRGNDGKLSFYLEVPALIAEYQTRLPDKQLLQAKLHEFYALNTAQGEEQ